MREKTSQPISGRESDLVLINIGKTRYLVKFTVPVCHKVKMKESEKINKYLDLAREQKKMWRETMIPL